MLDEPLQTNAADVEQVAAAGERMTAAQRELRDDVRTLLADEGSRRRYWRRVEPLFETPPLGEAVGDIYRYVERMRIAREAWLEAFWHPELALQMVREEWKRQREAAQARRARRTPRSDET